MKVRGLVLCLSLVALGTDLEAQTKPADVELYGPYPTNYQEIAMKWLQTKLIDPASARIEWEGEPATADLGSKGQHLYGWLVKVKVNSRNQFGAYTGKQTHTLLIRNGEVIKAVGFGY